MEIPRPDNQYGKNDASLIPKLVTLGVGGCQGNLGEGNALISSFSLDSGSGGLKGLANESA